MKHETERGKERGEEKREKREKKRKRERGKRVKTTTPQNPLRS
jgi:hypothetical protein